MVPMLPIKLIVALLAWAVLVNAISACHKQAKPVTASQRTDMFTEARGGTTPAKGKVHLIVRASVKTPTPEHYLLESKPQRPLDDGFPFELEIDGQEIIWRVHGIPEKTPLSGPEGRLPEGGEGMRYVLEKTIELVPGPHHVVFGVPYDDYYTEVKISLPEGKGHILEFQPTYQMGRRGYATFFRGISRTAVFLDEIKIK